MSTIQPIAAVVEKFGEETPEIVAAFRPKGNSFGRTTGWIKAMNVGRVRVSRNTLRQLKDQGFTRVRLSKHVPATSDVGIDFNIEELLND